MKYIIVFLILLIMSLATMLGYKTTQLQVARAELQRLPTVRDIQRRVGANVDGKICNGWAVPDHSETITLWDRAICNQDANTLWKEMKYE